MRSRLCVTERFHGSTGEREREAARFPPPGFVDAADPVVIFGRLQDHQMCWVTRA